MGADVVTREQMKHSLDDWFAAKYRESNGDEGRD